MLNEWTDVGPIGHLIWNGAETHKSDSSVLKTIEPYDEQVPAVVAYSMYNVGYIVILWSKLAQRSNSTKHHWRLLLEREF